MAPSFDPSRAIPPRFPVRVPAVTEPVERLGDPCVGEVQNMSRGGLLLWLTRAMVPGAAVRVTLSLCRRPPLALAGSVVWVRPHPDLPGWALGIQFGEDLPGEILVEIADEEYPPWERRRPEGPAEQAFGTVG